MANTLPLGEKDLPKPLPLKRLIGPSFILLGLGLGSGEVILWPYLASNYGLGIAWAIVIGLTMQFFINMEVERYALIYGESIFVGFARLLKFLPAWFILSTFLGFGWPGIGLAGATLLSKAFGIENVQVLGVGIFLVIGAVLTFGKVLYKTVERLQMWLIGIGVPFIIGVTFYLAQKSDFVALGQGIIGQGEGFEFLPVGIPLAAFLGALAYSGAGGNLNLAQSFYVRDKGYGMGKYADKITGLFRKGGKQKFSITGNTFDPTTENVSRFNKWWKVINLEHLIVFWGLGLITMLTLALLAYVTSFGLEGNAEGINFVINEAGMIAQRTAPMLGILFLLATGIMLCATQLTVLDSTSRIIAENFMLLSRGSEFNVTKIYYSILWIQILFGITVFSLGFDQPLTLIILGASFNAFAMFVYSGLLLWLNNKFLAKALRPAIWRNIVMLATFLFLGVFSYLTVADKLGF
ncbi:MAG: Nramp family divalent metal transporter [Kiritimatiellales bacterium]|nr:Nramp family divalent metal transporter [Kiritimatiellales bacterium]